MAGLWIDSAALVCFTRQFGNQFFDGCKLVNAITISADCVQGRLLVRVIPGGAEEAIADAKTSAVIKSCTALVEISFPVRSQHIPLIATGFSLLLERVLETR